MKRLCIDPIQIIRGSLTVFLLITLNSGLEAAIKDVAWLQGDQLSNGSPSLRTTRARAIDFNLLSTVDPEVYEHSFAASHELVAKKSGDYLVAATLPISVVSGQRVTQSIEVYVNGRAAAGTLGQSTYIRNASNHTESSAHIHTLLTGLVENDVIEVRTRRIAVADGESTMETASLYVEYVAASRTVFSGLATETQSGLNLNIEELTDDPALVWQAARNDSGFTHTDGESDIRLDGAGDYLVFLNIPLNGTVARASVAAEVFLDGNRVPGGLAQQGYIRNSSGHTSSSLHWCGLVRTTRSNQTLSFETFQRAVAGTVRIPVRKQASVYVEKVETSSDVFAAHAFDLEESDSWNPPEKMAILWESSDQIIDSTLFGHSAGLSAHQVEIKQPGHYLLLYNDTIEGGATRANPRITVEVNGSELPGAQTKTHYIRNTGGHNNSSATLVYLLHDLAANDVVTVSVQQEGGGGDPISEEPALITLIRKGAFESAPDNPAPPRVASFQGNLFGFDITIEDLGLETDPSSAGVVLNGESVQLEVSKRASLTMLSYRFPVIPNPGTPHTVQLSFSDTSEPPQTFESEFTFRTSTQYMVIPPDYARISPDTSQPGFTANITQISEAQTGSSSLHQNLINGAERQLAGQFTDPATGDPYLNEAGPTTATDWQIRPIEIESVINWEQDALIAGNFHFDNGFDDDFIPEIPGWGDSLDGIVVELLTFLDLKKGLHTLGVNSDDGFELRILPSVPEQSPNVMGRFNSGRAAGDTLMDILIREAGVYPFRLLWFEGGGGASLEFFSIHDDEMILINDTQNPNAIRAYRAAPTRPYITRITPQTNDLSPMIEFEIIDQELTVNASTVELVVDGTEVTPTVTQDGGVTSIRHDNGEFFGVGEHLIVLSYGETDAATITRTIEHRFQVPPGQPAVFRDGPVAYWPLGETEGDTAVSSVGEGLNGQYRSATGSAPPRLGVGRLAVGAASTAVEFDKGRGHFIAIPDHPDLNNAFGNPGFKERSIELWFKAFQLPRSIPGEAFPERQILFEEGGSVRGLNIYLQGTQDTSPNEAALYFHGWNVAQDSWGGTDSPVFVTTTIQANQIYHVVLVMNGDDGPNSFNGTLSGYVNGKLAGEATGVHVLYNHDPDIGIGAMNERTAFHDQAVDPGTVPGLPLQSFFFDGIIDEVAVYNDALSAEQVQAHFDEGNTEVPFEPPTPTDGGIHSIALNGTTVVIEFTGTLKTANNLLGPYDAVADAQSPYSTPADASAAFFIVE